MSNLSDFINTSFPRYDLASASTTTTLDLDAQQVYRVSVISNISLSFANEPGANRAMTVVIRFSGSGGTVTYPSGIIWNGGAAPELSVTWTAVTLMWDGVNWNGFKSGGSE